MLAAAIGPVAGGILGGAVAVGNNLLGRPFELWSRQVSAANDPWVRNAAYGGNRDLPNVLPSVDALLTMHRRGMLTDNDAVRSLQMLGVVSPSGTLSPNQQIRANSAFLRRLWRNSAELQMSRPEAPAIIMAQTRGRITDSEFRRLWEHLDASADRYRIMANAQYEMPGLNDLWQLWRRGPTRGGISDAEYRLWTTRLGWTNSDALKLSQRVSALPTLLDSLLWYWRGQRTQADNDQFIAYANASGWTDNEALRMQLRAMRPIPGPSDLVRFAIREVWDADTVRRWGYDDEFPEPLHAWMRWYGMDTADTVQDRQGRNLPNVPWPLAYWRAHWQIISPQQAYRALHLLRPDRLHRYQAISPGVTAFTAQDMATVLKVSDYPPKMRAWLQAIAFQPLRLTDIRSALANGVRDRQWAVNQLLDRGYVREDADTVADLWMDADAIALRNAAKAEQKAITRQIVTELRAAYRMGGMDAQAASNRLAGMGWSTRQIQRLLALEDTRAARERLTVFLRQLRRSYLSGALSDQEAVTSLAAAKIASPAIQRYLLLWKSELGVERRSLSTQQIVQAVASGALSPAIAAVRMNRLGWTAPDAALLLQEAAAKLARAQASAANQAANRAARQASALLAAQRQAQSALRSAQTQLRRTYPLAALKRQYCLGIRRGQTISALLLSQGYTPDSIYALLKQWTIECEESPPAAEKVAVAGAAYARRQTPVSTIKQWWQNGIVTDQWARARLAAVGVEPGAIAATIQLWQSTLGKKSGPATTATPQTQPVL